jgi:hypothetical protein
MTCSTVSIGKSPVSKVKKSSCTTTKQFLIYVAGQHDPNYRVGWALGK